jgi:hypothetical protein
VKEVDGMAARASDEPTDLSILTCPASVLSAVGDGRLASIFGHGFEINLDWWNERLEALDLSGQHLIAGKRGGELVFEGTARIEREDLFGLADDACATPDGALNLLWHVLAWGSGNKRRNNSLRLQAVAADVDKAGAGLRQAAELSRKNAKAAYELCCPSPGKNVNLVKNLGPSFATKYLYFAGAGRPEHPCLIMDERVAASLHDRAGWDSLGARNWPADTYERYCQLLQRWSAELIRDDRAIFADELERALFELAG